MPDLATLRSPLLPFLALGLGLAWGAALGPGAPPPGATAAAVPAGERGEAPRLWRPVGSSARLRPASAALRPRFWAPPRATPVRRPGGLGNAARTPACPETLPAPAPDPTRPSPAPAAVC